MKDRSPARLPVVLNRLAFAQPKPLLHVGLAFPPRSLTIFPVCSRDHPVLRVWGKTT